MLNRKWMPEIACVAITIAMLATSAILNLHAGLRWQSEADVLILPIAVGAPLIAACFVWSRLAPIGEMAFYFMLHAIAGMAALHLSYLGVNVGFPLQDANLAHVDSLLGFDWNRWQAFLHSRPLMLDMLDAAYKSHSWQLGVAVILLALLRPRSGNAFLFLALATAVIFTAAIGTVLPAIGPGYALGWPAPPAPVIEALRHYESGSVLPYAGIISFPSFHTVMAILYTFAYRELKPMLTPAAALNTLMLFSVPFSGDHYLTDMIGGAVVALLAAWIAARAMGSLDLAPSRSLFANMQLPRYRPVSATVSA